jgi:FAD/FMN-containing dehydrogenase
MDEFVEQVARAPQGGECSISLWGLGGAIDRVPDDAMAFTGRGAACWMGVETLWEDPEDDEAHVSWGRTTMRALERFTAQGHYVNDMVEQGEDVVRSIYGDKKYDRLRALKRKHDPDNIFRHNQNIRPIRAAHLR